MLIQRKVKFILHKRKSSDSTGIAIRMRVTIRGQRPFDFPTSCKVNLDNWDTSSERVTSEAPDATRINNTLDEYRGYINDIFARYELIEKRIPTPQEVKALFNDLIGRTSILDGEEQLTLWHVFDMFTRQVGKSNQWTESTYKKFKTIKRLLTEFDPNLSFESLSDDKLQDLIIYFERKKGYRNTTIHKYLGFVKWFLRWSAHKGYYTGKLHDTFKPKLKGISVDSKEIIYLSQQEIRQLQGFEIPESKKSLERVRDIFLFQCFTGLRYSDVAKLKRSDIKHGIMHVVTKKTVDGLRIELNKHSQAILDKYQGYIYPNDKALPIISNDKMNEYLKELGQLAGLTEPTRIVYFKGNQRYEEVFPKWYLLTTHVGRRTFVVTALQLGIPVEVIMRWTGHSNYEAMKPYVAIVDELKERSMSKFDQI